MTLKPTSIGIKVLASYLVIRKASLTLSCLRLLKAVYEQARSLKMLELLPILKALPEHVNTSLTVWDITAFAPAVYKVNFNEIITIILPGEYKEVYEEVVGEYTDYYYLDFEKSHALLMGFGLK